MTAVVLGLTTFGYLASTLGEHAFPPSKAASADTIENHKVGIEPSNRAPEPRWATPGSPATDPLDEMRGVADLPRECDPGRGIDTACIFN